MKVNVTLPFDNIANPDEFLNPEAVRQIGSVLERAGFNGGNVTDHPCPTGRWLDGGGHHAQDPFVVMSMLAATTTKLRLQTGILVLPYRNPFITARAVATLDVLSGGRVTLGVGAGYMKGEYFALGVDFERRNDIFDEYINALKAAWGGEEFSFKGTGYEARGNRILPLPVQKPHPPLLIGGNSHRAIRRAVESGDAWYPFFTAGPLNTTARTAAMTGETELLEGMSYLKEHCAAIGREKPPEVILSSLTSPGEKLNPAALIDRIGRYQELGITGVALHIEGRTRAEWCENVERCGADVLAKIPAG
jgi:probable F420-dependent oxidoreductase